MRCLLIAPTPGADPENGDVQYTRDLLADPPPGVEYVTYPDALAAGELSLGPTSRAWREMTRHPAATVAKGAVRATRQAGVLLPDIIRWWRVTGRFDVVHIHCLPVRFIGRGTPPIVVTDSAGTFWYWTAAHGRTAPEVWKLLRRERRIGLALRYVHPTATPDLADRALYFVDSGLRLCRELGIDTTGFAVAPTGVPMPARQAPLDLDPPTVLFVAHNFEIKGGNEVLEIFSAVRSTLPAARLIVAGSPLPDPKLPGVSWLGPMNRSALYEHAYPRADLFLYPTKFDTASLVASEALAHGIPVVGPNALCMPDLVQHERTGLLVEPGDIKAYVEATLALLQDRARLVQYGRAAAESFGANLSAPVRNAALLGAYRAAIADRSRA